MTIDEVISGLENKAFSSSAVSSSGSLTAAAEQVIIEARWTDHLQRLVEFGNKNCLRNFSLRLEIECDTHGLSIHQ